MSIINTNAALYSPARRVLHEREKRHYNPKRQGHHTKVTRQQMYEMRYRFFIEHWTERKIEKEYGVEWLYLLRNVLDYQTMASVVPVKGVKPEDYSG